MPQKRLQHRVLGRDRCDATGDVQEESELYVLRAFFDVAVLGTIEYYDNKNSLVFQTTEDEKDHLVLQLGVPTPELAVQAAKIVYGVSTGIER